MSNICRLCLRNEEHIQKKNIFDISMCNTLYWIFEVQVDVTDTYSKLICEKCLNLINKVQKIRRFFQTNQMLLIEKNCPIDFHTELVNMDVGTQTDCNQPTTLTSRPSWSEIANKPINSHLMEGYTFSNNLAQLEDTTYFNNDIQLPVQLDHMSPEVVLLKLEDVCSSLRYQQMGPLTYKKVKNDESLENNDDDKYCSIISNISEQPNNLDVEPMKKQKRCRVKCRSIGTNTEIVLGNSYLPRNYAKKQSIGTNTKLGFHIFPKRNIAMATNTETDTEKQKQSRPKLSDQNFISAPTDAFQSCKSSVVTEKLGINETSKKTKPQEIEKTSKRKRKVKGDYLEYFYSMPSFALKELISEPNKKSTVGKKVVQTSKPVIKISDILRPESCDICHQAFKSKERLKIHHVVRHNKNVLRTSEANNDCMLKPLSSSEKVKNGRKLRNGSNSTKVPPKKLNKEDSTEEIDVTTIRKELNSSSDVPDVILFNEVQSFNRII